MTVLIIPQIVYDENIKKLDADAATYTLQMRMNFVHFCAPLRSLFHFDLTGCRATAVPLVDRLLMADGAH
jgi:hypothetical protein